MAYRVEVTARAVRDLKSLYRYINASDSGQARAWFDGLEKAAFSLDQNPARGAMLPRSSGLRHLLYGNHPHVYRIIFAIDESRSIVTVPHIRHGARAAR